MSGLEMKICIKENEYRMLKRLDYMIQVSLLQSTKLQHISHFYMYIVYA